MDRLAEAHVVGEARPSPPLGQTGSPLESFDLVLPQVGLERGGDLWVQRLSFAKALDLLGPSGVGINRARVFDDGLQSMGPRSVESQSFPLSIEESRQILNALPEPVSERYELVVLEGQEAPGGAFGEIQHLP